MRPVHPVILLVLCSMLSGCLTAVGEHGDGRIKSDGSYEDHVEAMAATCADDVRSAQLAQQVAVTYTFYETLEDRGLVEEYDLSLFQLHAVRGADRVVQGMELSVWPSRESTCFATYLFSDDGEIVTLDLSAFDDVSEDGIVDCPDESKPEGFDSSEVRTALSALAASWFVAFKDNSALVAAFDYDHSTHTTWSAERDALAVWPPPAEDSAPAPYHHEIQFWRSSVHSRLPSVLTGSRVWVYWHGSEDTAAFDMQCLSFFEMID